MLINTADKHIKASRKGQKKLRLTLKSDIPRCLLICMSLGRMVKKSEIGILFLILKLVTVFNFQ